jgi:hypothetical protein
MKTNFALIAVVLLSSGAFAKEWNFDNLKTFPKKNYFFSKEKVAGQQIGCEYSKYEQLYVLSITSNGSVVMDNSGCADILNSEYVRAQTMHAVKADDTQKHIKKS